MVQYIILGLIQGFTEFLPVSSSGHLVILQSLFGMQEYALAVALVLHLGTVASLIVFFFKDILSAIKKPRIIGQIIIVTVVTGLIAFSGKSYFESLFSSPKAVAVALLFTAAMLFLAKARDNGRKHELSFKDVIFLGIAQGIAVIPGISRSGFTISALLLRGVDRETSFRFSFLAAIPAICGAVILEFRESDFVIPSGMFLPLALGFAVSFVFGLLALWLLKKVLIKSKLHYFAYYCMILAIVVFVFIK